MSTRSAWPCSKNEKKNLPRDRLKIEQRTKFSKGPSNNYVSIPMLGGRTPPPPPPFRDWRQFWMAPNGFSNRRGHFWNCFLGLRINAWSWWRFQPIVEVLSFVWCYKWSGSCFSNMVTLVKRIPVTLYIDAVERSSLVNVIFGLHLPCGIRGVVFFLVKFQCDDISLNVFLVSPLFLPTSSLFLPMSSLLHRNVKWDIAWTLWSCRRARSIAPAHPSRRSKWRTWLWTGSNRTVASPCWAMSNAVGMPRRLIASLYAGDSNLL